MSMPKQIKLEQVSRGETSRGAGARGAVAAGLLCLGLSLLAGCITPQAVVPAATRSPESVGIAPQAVAPAIASDWWAEFGDPGLTMLIDAALAGTPGLRVVQARLTSAQAGVDAARAAAGPVVGSNAEAIYTRFSENGLVRGELAGASRWVGLMQANASWELDFFGRHEAALRAALGSEQAVAAELQAARVLLASDIARVYVRLAAILEQRDLARRALEQREAYLLLVRQRVDAGLDAALELRLAEGLPPVLRRQIEALEGQAVLARNALAALSAQPPAAVEGLAPRLRDLRQVEVPEILPANLLGRRADIHAARWRVEAAVQDVAVARADFYPNVNLRGLVGLSAIGLDMLLRADSLLYSAGPAIQLPIFDAGRLRARLSGRAADLDGAVEAYNVAMIDAVRDVVDQIGTLKSVARQRSEQEAALRSAQSVLDLSRDRYRAGLVSRLPVLVGESALLDQQAVALELDARSMDARLALIRALGGGYAAPATPTSQSQPQPLAAR